MPPATALARDIRRPVSKSGKGPRAKTKRKGVTRALKSAPSAARTSSAKTKDNSVNLRVDDETKFLIDRAAFALGQSRTEFMLRSARERATEILLNQTLFVLGGANWSAFVDALDTPPPPNAKLKALLLRKAPWDDQADDSVAVT